MQGEALETQDFETGDGTLFFEGYPQEGRHVYIVKSLEQGSFTAYGALDEEEQVVFVVKGTLAQLDDFVTHMEKEGAKVTYGLPPFDTNTGGDKAPNTSRPGLVADTEKDDPRPSASTEGNKAADTKQSTRKSKRGVKK